MFILYSIYCISVIVLHRCVVLTGDLSSLVDHGHLAQIKENKPDYAWLTALSNFKHIIRKTLRGVEYLHKCGIVHRDIKGNLSVTWSLKDVIGSAMYLCM